MKENSADAIVLMFLITRAEILESELGGKSYVVSDFL